MYYKNILGIILILFSFYLYESYEKEITIRKRKLLISLFIITGAILASIHRPSFYIFGIVYTIYSIVSPYEKNIYHSKKLFINFLIGLSMIILGLLFYIGRICKYRRIPRNFYQYFNLPILYIILSSICNNGFILSGTKKRIQSYLLFHDNNRNNSI